jgi:hypothetical protein
VGGGDEEAEESREVAAGCESVAEENMGDGGEDWRAEGIE